MTNKKNLFYICIGLSLLAFFGPGLGLVIGDHFQQQITKDETPNKVQVWRIGKLAYRGSLFSPLYWEAAQHRLNEIDHSLSTAMYQLVLLGSNNIQKNALPIDRKKHRQFIETRQEQKDWQQENLFSLLRYGLHNQLPKALESHKTNAELQPYGLANALLSGNIEALDKWLPVAPTEATGLYFYTKTAIEGTEPFERLIQAYQNPQKADWQKLFATADETLQPIVVEAYARSGSADPQHLQSMLNAANPNWYCAQLAAASVLQDAQITQQALETIAQQKDRMYSSSITIATDALCHAQVFENTYRETVPPALLAWLHLAHAHSQLAQLDVKAAQKTLQVLKPQELATPQQIIYFYLQSLSGEMSGNLPYMEQFATQGKAVDAGIFTMMYGKALLLRTQKTEAIQSLYGRGKLSLPKQLMPIYYDLCATAQRVNGNAVKIKVNGQNIPYGMWERSAEFRTWFSNHLNTSTQLPPPSTIILPVLLNQQRVNQNGDFLVQTFWDNQVNPFNIAIRTQIHYLYKSYKQNRRNIDPSSAEKTRQWLSKLPFPQLLTTHPNKFTVQIKAPK